MEDTAGLRIRLLGELAATRDGLPLDLGGRRQRAVLAVLLLERGAVVPADRLLQAVWDEQLPPNAVGALQSYVSHLRRRLEPDSPARARSGIIVREGPGYAVRVPADAVDAWRFESLVERAGAAAGPHEAVGLLREALHLWRGPALADYADEPWAEAERIRLTSLRTAARERLLAVRLDLGDGALLVPELEAMVAEEPLREERWRLLALALYRAGRQGDALAAVRRARTTLAEELGVDPGPALRELEAQLLAQAPSLEPPRQRRQAPPPPAAAGAEPPARPRLPAHDDLLERDAERDVLRSALDDLQAGEPGLVLVEGPAGIGKSRLLAEARRLAAQRSVRMLAGRGSPLERTFAFGVVRQLFEGELATRQDELLAGPAASARGVFDLSVAHPADGSFAVLHGLYWLALGVAASAPVMVVVDDAQWCDVASLRFLSYLARRLDAVPLLLVVAVRTGETQDERSLLDELASEPSAVVVRPGPLSAEATATLVEHGLRSRPAPLFVAACHRVTSGNPLLLRQLLRALQAEGLRPDAAHADVVIAVGSRAVSHLVLARLRRASTEALAVARAVAVLGDGAPLPAVAALAEVPEEEAAALLADLARAEVLKDEQPVAFVHPLVREAVYRDLSVGERELRHERAAAVLLEAGARAEQVAAHLLLAPPRRRAGTVELLRSAARAAAARGATDSAVTYLRRALDEPPDGAVRQAVLVELGVLEARLDGTAAVEHLQEAYERLGDHAGRAALAVAVATTHVFASPPGVATAFARRAARELPVELDDHRQALAALERISGFIHGVDDGWRAVRPPEPTGPGPGARMLAATLAIEATVEGTDRDRAVTLARSALEGDLLWQLDDGLFWVLAANVRMLADDELGDYWSRAKAAGYARGSLFTALSTSIWEGFWQWRRGELHEALSCLSVASDQIRMWRGAGVAEPYARAFEIGCHLDRGDLAAARVAADAGLTRPGVGDGARLLRQAVARLLVAEGRPAQALETVAAASRPGLTPNPVWDPWRSITAAALHGLGERQEAVRLAEEEVRLLRRWGAPSFLGAGLRLLGELVADDDADRAAPLLREAVTVLRGTTAAVELARARCALGGLRPLPDAEAVPLLLAAEEVACARGAAGVRDRARESLRRRGRPPRLDVAEVRPLSATERRVIDLTAAGAGVRDVAQQLFLTPGTVLSVLDRVRGRAADSPGATAQVLLK